MREQDTARIKNLDPKDPSAKSRGFRCKGGKENTLNLNDHV